jgi:hypothetical protein
MPYQIDVRWQFDGGGVSSIDEVFCIFCVLWYVRSLVISLVTSNSPDSLAFGSVLI